MMKNYLNLGYSCEVMNIKTECKLTELHWLFDEKRHSSQKCAPNQNLPIHVIGELPKLSIDFGGDDDNRLKFDETLSSTGDTSMTVSVTLFAGQKYDLIKKIFYDIC